MPEHIDLYLEDEPEPERPRAGDRLVIDADELDAAPAPGGFSPLPGPPVAFGKAAPARLLGSVLWQTALAGSAGGLLAWLVAELLLPERQGSMDQGTLLLDAGLFFGFIGAMLGVALGAVDGLAARVAQKAALGAAIGLGLGCVGGCLGGVVGQYVFGELTSDTQMARPSLLALMMIRGFGWMLVGGFVGLAQGVAVRAARKIRNGLIGGLIGGAIGGLLFDPIGAVLANVSGDGTGTISRALAITVLGAATGLAIGMAEELTKQAWLRVVAGPLSGKEFIIYHAATTIGASPGCEIALLKDPGIMPEHCRIVQVPGGYELHSAQAMAPTYVNGRPVQRVRLRDGDQIVVGGTALGYAERAAKSAAGGL